MSLRESEADARIVIDELLKQAGWDPSDKSMVGTEVPSSQSPEQLDLVGRWRASEVLAIEKEITAGLEKLLHEVEQ